MIAVLAGILGCLAAWLIVMQAIAWSWNRHSQFAVADGQVSQADVNVTIARVARRHPPGWTAFLFGFFFLLGVASFPLWQRLAFGLLLSLIYGLAWVSRGERELEKSERVFLFGEAKDAIWYRLLAVAEWAGYLGLLIFASEFLLKIF